MKKLITSIFFLFPWSLFAQLELPKITNLESVIKRDNYTLQYNEQHEQADWVAYELLWSEIVNDIDRTDNFREDPLVTTGSASLADYKGSGYDRGHLAPAADMKKDKEAMSDSFYMSNMSPQIPSLNRGRWKDLEALVRSWAYQYNSIYIVTGPVLNRSDFATIGPNNVSIPDYYYKAVLLNKDDQWQSIAFILPNIKGKEKESLQSYVYSVDSLEDILDFDLFIDLPDNIENEIEKNVELNKWSFEKSSIPVNEVSSQETEEPEKLYWINTSSNTIHNESCKYYGKTKNGYYTSEEVGKPCSICGGL